MTKRIIGVMLGRFSPVHKGHQKIINRVIKDFGIQNTLLLIGSSTSYNNKTPYTFSERKKMLKTLYPSLQILGIADTSPNKVGFEKETLDIWIKKIKKIEKSKDSEFIFYGGSKKDIGYLMKDFKTSLPKNIQRFLSPISGTGIRKAIKTGDFKILKKYLDPKIIPYAVSGIKKFEKVKTK